MKSNKSSLYRGMNSKVGDFLVNRLIPFDTIRSIGSIVFLDHLYPVNLQYENSPIPLGNFAHPHRGIATLSYVLSGSLSHYDSKGNYDIISTGGMQWMKAGNGIVHDEKPFTTEKDGPFFHSLQFWINLPGVNKKEKPEYIAIQSGDVQEIELPDHSGAIRILVGKFGVWASPVPTFNEEFIYHIRLNPNSMFSFKPHKSHQVAAFVPSVGVNINKTFVGNSKMLILEDRTKEIIFQNDKIKTADILLFGGAPYTEPIVAEGPFVMNSYSESAAAYGDFFAGAYGNIDYEANLNK
ncbi:pirin family protein [Flavobacterium tructae]|uniref:pirin family protein n=1 Tax=Flavobacterium tructae TaxID=1114873 RepID=UPI002551E4C4|nr:pirin family protein [Flavobacterium tructae]MDL2141693.1 pirin family protein [Flavobacterium tructae]